MKGAITYFLKIIDVGSVYYLLATVLAAIIWFSFRNKKKIERVSFAFLLPYLFLVIISTIVTRNIKGGSHVILKPFWTIETILTGGKRNAWLIKEIAMNILMLLPVGLLSPVFFIKKKLKKTMLLGFGISLSIELLQFIMDRGLAEIDDLIFNTLGVLIGFGIYRVVKEIISTFIAFPTKPVSH